jgi:Phage capsid protein
LLIARRRKSKARKLFSGAIKKYWRWFGVNWIMHPNLTGVGSNAEKCYIFHRNAIGHAVDKKGVQSPVGYDEEQDYSWARVSVYMGSKLLQNTGIVQVNHDGSAFALS